MLDAHGDEIAAIIVEPVAGNMGCVRAARGLPRGAARACATEHGALLIFDEVMTGFRVARGGAQELYGITPDLTCLGKIVGGGLPVARVRRAARRSWTHVAPLGPVYQAGTLSGNPLAMVAGCRPARPPGASGQLRAPRRADDPPAGRPLARGRRPRA